MMSRESPILIGLRRRLATDKLTPQDKGKLEMARALKIMRKEGLTLVECAQKVGATEPKVRQFLQTGIYAIFHDYLETQELSSEDKQIEKVVKRAKQEFALFAPDMIDYYRSCYKRDEKGEWKDDAKAMWASERVSKGLGLLEPEHVARPVVNINIAHIRAEQAMVGADDAEAAAAAKAIDVTPTTKD